MPPSLVLALDVPDRAAAIHLLDRLAGHPRWVKIGLELFIAAGPAVVEDAAARGHDVFLDLKLHDIPNTVASAVRSVSRLPVRMLTIHGSGGPAMIRAAADAAQARADLLLLGVTVLTSSDDATLAATGVAASSVADQVLRLGRLATSNGLRGLVCSPRELPALRSALGGDIALVTPGIRPTGSPPDDQRRTLTPAEAVAAGARFLVVGRPILLAPDPAAAARSLQAEIAAS